MDPTGCSILFLLGSAAVSHQGLKMPSSPAAASAGVAVYVYHIPSQTHHVNPREVNVVGVSNWTTRLLIFVARVRVEVMWGSGTGRPAPF